MLHRILLFSTDPRLIDTSRGIVRDVFGGEMPVTLGRAGERVTVADFCIWDCTSDVDVAPERLLGIHPRKHLFILPSEDLVRLKARVSPTALKFICKPVSEESLRSFFRRAHRQWRSSENWPVPKTVRRLTPRPARPS